MNFKALLNKADGLVSPDRIRRWSAIFLAAQVILFAIVVAGTHGMFVILDHPTTTDFASFYAAGTLANGAHPALVYDRLAHYLAEQAATQPGIDYAYFFYPPIFLLICGFIAHLPYLYAFVLFEALTAAACLLTLRAILGASTYGWVLPALSFMPVTLCIGMGQNSFLTAALFGCGTLLLQSRRPVAAGLVLACLCYKPHTGLLIPVALFASGSIRALLGAAVGVALLVGASVLAFGAASWYAFLHAFVNAQGDFSNGKISPFHAQASLYAAASTLGASPAIARAVESIGGVVVAACVFHGWRSRECHGTRYALLISGTILIMPVVLVYDLLLLLVAAAWLFRASRLTGSLPGERIGLAVIWLGGLLSFALAGHSHLPVGCACAVGIFVLALIRQHQSSVPLLVRNKDTAGFYLGVSNPS